MFNSEQKSFYRIEQNFRVYNYETPNNDLIISEFLVHLYDHIKLGYKIYYLNYKSNYDFSLNIDELNYLNTDSVNIDEPLYYFFSENVKKIKCFQKIDLFRLTNLKNLDLLILIPKLDDGNKYYFDLILAVKIDFKIECFNNLHLNSVNLNNVIELNYFNLSLTFLKKIFNFEKNKFKDNQFSLEERNIWDIDFTNTNLKFSNKNRRIYKKAVFKQICYHVLWLGGDYQLKNTVFQLDWGYKEKILIPNSDVGFNLIESYHNYCLEDLINDNPEYFYFNSWRVYNCFF